MEGEEEIKNISIENLQLDLYNPRLPKSKQGKDKSVVIEYLLLEAATLELMESIGENDFFGWLVVFGKFRSKVFHGYCNDAVVACDLENHWRIEA